MAWANTACVSHVRGLYIVGGAPHRLAMKYTFSTNLWHTLPDISVKRAGYPCVFLLNNHLYIGGGYIFQNRSQLSTMESLDLNNVDKGWQPSINILPIRVNGVACATIKGKVVLFGGYHGQIMTRLIFRWSPQVKRWWGASSMNTVRNDACAVSYGVQFIYVLGGTNHLHTVLASVERYNIQNNSWTSLNPMPSDLTRHACIYIEGTIIVSGGKSGSTLKDNIYLYTVTSGIWTMSSTHLTTPMKGHMLGLKKP